MKDNLLEVVIQSAYDSGYKDGYSKATQNIEHDLIVPLSEKSHVIQKLWLTPKDLAWAVVPHIITQSIGFLDLMVWEIYVAKFIFRTYYPNIYAKVLIVAIVVQIIYFGFL